MQYVTRTKFIQNTLKDFLESSDDCIIIKLYSKEIRKIKRDYGSMVEVEKGPKTKDSFEDKRYNCTISKK